LIVVDLFGGQSVPGFPAPYPFFMLLAVSACIVGQVFQVFREKTLAYHGDFKLVKAWAAVAHDAIGQVSVFARVLPARPRDVVDIGFDHLARCHTFYDSHLFSSLSIAVIQRPAQIAAREVSCDRRGASVDDARVACAGESVCAAVSACSHVVHDYTHLVNADYQILLTHARVCFLAAFLTAAPALPCSHLTAIPPT
jgi:hypothetical protein